MKKPAEAKQAADGAGGDDGGGGGSAADNGGDEASADGASASKAAAMALARAPWLATAIVTVLCACDESVLPDALPRLLMLCHHPAVVAQDPFLRLSMRFDALPQMMQERMETICTLLTGDKGALASGDATRARRPRRTAHSSCCGSQRGHRTGHSAPHGQPRGRVGRARKDDGRRAPRPQHATRAPLD